MSTASKPIPALVEVVIWALLLFAAASAERSWRPEPLSNDSYQYLNVAQNETRGLGLATSLICFDSERSHGVIPAPLTTFAPGYPVLIAIFSHLLGDLQSAARFISVFAFTCTGVLLACALVLTGVGAPWRVMAMALFATNAISLSFATSILTEPFYMLVTMTAVAALIWVEKSGFPIGIGLALSFVAYVLAGLSYFVRYAGLFFIAGLILHALLMLLIERTGRRAIQFCLSFVALGIAAILMFRNIASVGTWKGGNTMVVHNSLRRVLVDYVKAHFHLFFGEHKVVHGVWEMLFVASALVGFVCFVPLAVKVIRTQKSSLRPIDPSVLLVVLCIVVYTAGLFYAGLRSDISFGTRMFEPIFPLYILLFAVAVSWLVFKSPRGTSRFLFQAALAVGSIALFGINAREQKFRETPAPDQELIPLFAEPTADGQPLREWIAENIPRNATIFSEEGQSTGFLLGLPTVDMIDAEYSSARWECDDVKDQMSRFHSGFLILYKSDALGEASRLAGESRFVADSINLQPPCGFKIVAANSNVLVLKSADSDGALPIGRHDVEFR